MLTIPDWLLWCWGCFWNAGRVLRSHSSTLLKKSLNLAATTKSAPPICLQPHADSAQLTAVGTFQLSRSTQVPVFLLFSSAWYDAEWWWREQITDLRTARWTPHIRTSLSFAFIENKKRFVENFPIQSNNKFDWILFFYQLLSISQYAWRSISTTVVAILHTTNKVHSPSTLWIGEMNNRYHKERPIFHSWLLWNLQARKS